jgi:hypothetical protein
MKKLMIIGVVSLLLGLIAISIGGVSGGLNIDSFNFANANLKASQTKVVQPFQQINVDTKATVAVKTGNQFKVVSQAPKGIQFHTSVKNDQLNITQSGKSTSTNYLQFLKIGGDIHNKVNGKITIYIPNHYQLTQITQTQQNSFIDLERIAVKHPLTLHGELYLIHVTAPSVNINGKNNDIDVEHSSFKNGISMIKIIGGDIDIYKSNFQQLTQVRTENGDNAVDNVTVSKGSTNINSTNGDIRANHSHFETLKLSSHSGDVDFNFLTIRKSLAAITNSGDVNGQLLSDDHAHIKGSSDNGDVDIRSSLNHPNANKQYDFHTNNGDIEIK